MAPTSTTGPDQTTAATAATSSRDPSWVRPALLSLLAATAVFYLWNLTSSGYANAFYSAAAQAGADSWKAFFFGSSDAANAITVDKPPASLWFMALSVRIFGLSSFAILLPEVLMGVATVGVVYATVKRQFGAAAGLLAGGILALTPVAVLMQVVEKIEGMDQEKNPKVKAILVNIFGGIMKCDTIATGVITACKATNLSVPLVVRMKGTNEEMGKKMLAESGLPIISADTMADAAQKVVAAVNAS